MINTNQTQFSMIPQVELPRSTFNRSCGYKTTFNEGYLIPFFCDEVLPGDTFNLKATLFGRLTTPIVPFMDNLHLETFFFFVPNRLVWEHWQAFNGEQKKPTDSTDYLVPTIKAPSNGFGIQSVFDYFGLPTGIGNLDKINSLPLRAYNLIWNEWFRDENLQDSVEVPTGDSDSYDNYVLLKRNKRHDYFTSALPWPQKGPGVEVPIGGYAPLVGDLTLNQSFVNKNWNSIPNGSIVYGANTGLKPDGNPSADTGSWGTLMGIKTLNHIQSNRTGYQYELSLSNTLQADLSQATPVSINSLRQAFQLQRLYERDARGGTRYTEILRSHFGVISPDARLQRPEYLGGSSTNINITPVQQTSGTTSTSPQGNLAAFGVVGDSFPAFTKSFVEHGYIIGLVNVRADLNYQQGLNRMWSRQTRFDYYWPSLAHLGEQAILNKEIYAQATEADDEVFGYQERYAEYRYKPNLITGALRSTYAQSLDVWHLAQKFDNLPVLNSEFITENPPVSRVVAVQDEPHFILDCAFSLNCTRAMPVRSVPGLIDHF